MLNLLFYLASGLSYDRGRSLQRELKERMEGGRPYYEERDEELVAIYHRLHAVYARPGSSLGLKLANVPKSLRWAHSVRRLLKGVRLNGSQLDSWLKNRPNS
jgi:hypothetical protein